MEIIERHFDDELKELFRDLLKLATLAQEAINKSIEALAERSAGKAGDIIDADARIDELELGIDDKCIDLIARHQPMAVDLRFITMAMKMNTDLERIADLAVDIAQRVLELADKPLLKPLIDIPKLARLAQEMVKNAVDAFIRRDTELAAKVIFDDAEADRLRNLVQSELINEYMLKDANTVPRALPLLLIARHLERICDHATNIAEDVIYLSQAKVVKHHPEKIKE